MTVVIPGPDCNHPGFRAELIAISQSLIILAVVIRGLKLVSYQIDNEK